MSHMVLHDLIRSDFVDIKVKDIGRVHSVGLKKEREGFSDKYLFHDRG